MNTQQRVILSKVHRLLAMDAEWDESKHPRADNGQFGSGRPSENGRLNLPENPTRGDLRRAAKQWLSENLQGKTVPTSDGKKVTFNRNDSTDHLSFNASRSKLHAQAVTFVADVFQTGRFIGREELAHERKDNFVAFHKYQKQVEIDGYRVLLEAAAGELPNGELEAVDEMIAYNQRLAGKEKVGNAPASIETAKDNGQAAGFVSYANNHTPFAEDGQAHETVGYIRIMKITDQNGRDVTKTYDGDRLSLAQDRSMRSYDEDGRMHVETSNISKATVNPYYGSEIPNHQQLGLEPKKVYYLLRDPEELKKAVQSFNNLPLLSKHIPVSADEPQKDVIVGTTGSDAKFEDGYLKCSLAVWDSEAIAGIESGEQMELSSAYRYTADMTAGEFNGMHYDGVMRDIVGNHVALVDVGRAGRDVVVSDADPFHERNVMKLKKGAQARIKSVLEPLMAQDAELSPDELLQVIGSLTNEVQTAEDDGEELPPEDAEEVGTDEDGTAEDEDIESESEEVATDEDETNESEQPQEQPAQAQDRAMMKIAMDKAIAKAVAAERKRAQALAQAQRDVAHLVGDVAMDSAEDVYKFALEQHGVDVAGVHPSAYRAMVGLIGKSKGGIAMDSANSASKQFKGLNRIRKG
jgi:hypothetical protein